MRFCRRSAKKDLEAKKKDEKRNRTRENRTIKSVVFATRQRWGYFEMDLKLRNLIRGWMLKRKNISVDGRTWHLHNALFTCICTDMHKAQSNSYKMFVLLWTEWSGYHSIHNYLIHYSFIIAIYMVHASMYLNHSVYYWKSAYTASLKFWATILGSRCLNFCWRFRGNDVYP